MSVRVCYLKDFDFADTLPVQATVLLAGRLLMIANQCFQVPFWGWQPNRQNPSGSIPIAIRLLCHEPFETIRPTMQISARNVLKGKVAKLVEGAVNCEVTLEIAPGVEIVSIITKVSAASLGLAEGKIASAVIKASSVMIAVD